MVATTSGPSPRYEEIQQRIKVGISMKFETCSKRSWEVGRKTRVPLCPFARIEAAKHTTDHCGLVKKLHKPRKLGLTRELVDKELWAGPGFL